MESYSRISPRYNAIDPLLSSHNTTQNSFTDANDRLISTTEQFQADLKTAPFDLFNKDAKSGGSLLQQAWDSIKVQYADKYPGISLPLLEREQGLITRGGLKQKSIDRFAKYLTDLYFQLRNEKQGDEETLLKQLESLVKSLPRTGKYENFRKLVILIHFDWLVCGRAENPYRAIKKTFPPERYKIVSQLYALLLARVGAANRADYALELLTDENFHITRLHATEWISHCPEPENDVEYALMDMVAASGLSLKTLNNSTNDADRNLPIANEALKTCMQRLHKIYAGEKLYSEAEIFAKISRLVDTLNSSYQLNIPQMAPERGPDSHFKGISDSSLHRLADELINAYNKRPAAQVDEFLAKLKELAVSIPDVPKYNRLINSIKLAHYVTYVAENKKQPYKQVQELFPSITNSNTYSQMLRMAAISADIDYVIEVLSDPGFLLAKRDAKHALVNPGMLRGHFKNPLLDLLRSKGMDFNQKYFKETEEIRFTEDDIAGLRKTLEAVQKKALPGAIPTDQDNRQEAKATANDRSLAIPPGTDTRFRSVGVQSSADTDEESTQRRMTILEKMVQEKFQAYENTIQKLANTLNETQHQLAAMKSRLDALSKAAHQQ